MLLEVANRVIGSPSAAASNSPGSQLNSVCAFSLKGCVQKPSVLWKGHQPKVLAGSRAGTPSGGASGLIGSVRVLLFWCLSP